LAKHRFFVISIVLLYLGLLVQPTLAAEAVTQGLALCAGQLLPALFPYFVLSSLAVHAAASGRISRQLMRPFRLRGICFIPTVLGTVGGYPTGARCIAEFYRAKKLTKDEACRLLFFACNGGPAFLYGVIGCILYRSPSVGLVLLGVHISAALLMGLAQPGRRESAEETQISNIPPFSTALVQAIVRAAETSLQITAFVCFFRWIIVLVQQFLHPIPTVSLLVTAFLELSSGCGSIALSDLPWTAKFALTAATVGFGGLCVCMQTLSVLHSAGLPSRPYFIGKLIHAGLSAILAIPVSLLLRPAVQTAVQDAALRPVSPWPWWILSALLLPAIFLQFPSGNSGRLPL